MRKRMAVHSTASSIDEREAQAADSESNGTSCRNVNNIRAPPDLSCKASS